jgi:hypothetical protein
LIGFGHFSECGLSGVTNAMASFINGRSHMQALSRRLKRKDLKGCAGGALVKRANVRRMLIENRIRESFDKLVDCKDDLEALKLAQELQSLLHCKVEQLRTKLFGPQSNRKVLYFPPHD